MTSRPAVPESETPRWVSVHTVDEMEAFYKAILPQIRTEAKYHGYAIGLHGSMRRDLDLIAIPWSNDHSDKDELARAIQEAACGMPQMVYQWNTKPCGRMSVSIPVCWPEWPEEIGDGHIDLSVMPDRTMALSLAQTEIKGHMRVQDELREAAEAELDLRMQVERDLAQAQARIAELEKALVNSADSFKDVARCLRMIGHPISASACEMAEEGARDALKSRA